MTMTPPAGPRGPVRDLTSMDVVGPAAGDWSQRVAGSNSYSPTDERASPDLPCTVPERGGSATFGTLRQPGAASFSATSKTKVSPVPASCFSGSIQARDPARTHSSCECSAHPSHHSSQSDHP